MIVATLGLAAVLAAPADREAAEAAKRGEQAYAEARWRDAAEAFGRAYRLDPQPAYLYALAQAERLGDRCDRAIEHYEAFLRRTSEGIAAQTARDNLEACRAVLATSEPTSEPAPVPTSETPPDPDAHAQTPVSPPPPPRRPVLGLVAVSTGAAILIAGATLQGVARGQQRRAERAPNVLEYDRSISRAVLLGRASIPVLIVGGALTVAGVTHLIVVSRRSRANRETAWRLDAGGLHLRF